MNPAQDIHGPGLIGAFLNVFLLGIVVTQVFYYFTTYKKDRLWIKAYVAVLAVADLVNSIFDIYWLYVDLIDDFGNSADISVADWRFATDPAMVGIIATLVQLFFAWRLKVLTNNWWITGLVVLTAIASCCGGLGTAIAIHFVKQYKNFYKFDSIVAVWLASMAVCDTVIAIAMTWRLKRHKTGFQQTDDVVNKIIRLTVSTGAISAIWAIVDLILFLSVRTGVHLALNLPLAKLYTNSLLSSLNSRSGLKFNTEESDGDRQNMDKPVKSHAAPKFLQLSSSGARQEVWSPALASLSVLKADVTEQVVIHVESHEMVDVPDDAKWPVETRGRRTSVPVYKVQNIV
ncbi:uncharacterized protein PHACADRAFT_213079 [Phanerochaete carnosa HHB-10118-sp]|uniref:DUF6534 domain-containing protein n=1 Tax=Phanerochaete carnosa (strain HHB-10118-sp) TaxID=650164 RepID=K5VX77_PHACS|nr:uncharacterized protein PHACADRAFT_213079 [Phanerochaete carnosa HHB-10118-sp]EKM51209.1 hypothetical protein PHACADRAFT_213079 [Phanerochaete carnosa HHB-10118-sp]